MIVTLETENTEKVVFDPREALERIGGDETLLKEMIEIFGHVLRDDMEELERSVRSGDRESIKKNAHRIKGAIGNFGLNRAYQSAYALEQGSSCSHEEIEALFDSLRSEIYELNRELTRFLLG